MSESSDSITVNGITIPIWRRPVNEPVMSVYNGIRDEHSLDVPRGPPLRPRNGVKINWAGGYGKLLVPDPRLLDMIKETTMWMKEMPKPWDELGRITFQLIARAKKWIRRIAKYYKMDDITYYTRRFYPKLGYNDEVQLLKDVALVERKLGMILAVSKVYGDTILEAMRAMPPHLSTTQLDSTIPSTDERNNINTIRDEVLTFKEYLWDIREYDDEDDDVREWNDNFLMDYAHDMTIWSTEVLDMLKNLAVDVGGVPATDVARL